MQKINWNISIMTGIYWVLIAVLSTLLVMNERYLKDIQYWKQQTEAELVTLRSRNATLERLFAEVEDGYKIGSGARIGSKGMEREK